MRAEELKEKIFNKIAEIERLTNDEWVKLCCLLTRKIVEGAYQELLEEYDREVVAWLMSN